MSSNQTSKQLLVLALSIANMFFCAWAVTHLWWWFVVPTFGAPALSIPVVLGVRIMIGVFGFISRQPKTEDDWRDYRSYIEPIHGIAWELAVFLLTLAALGTGWILTLYM